MARSKKNRQKTYRKRTKGQISPPYNKFSRKMWRKYHRGDNPWG